MAPIVGLIYMIIGMLIGSNMIDIPEVTNEKIMSNILILGGTILVLLKEK